MADETDKRSGVWEGLTDGLVPYLQNQHLAQIEQEENNPVLPALHTRLQKLLDSIPESKQREGVSLLDLQACLRGRKGGLPHIGELGAAMRRLGWQRRRAWSDADTAFSSRWFPPVRG